jgi:hypothetical protein
VARNPFSIGWIIVSYFMICGGLWAALAAYALMGAEDPIAVGAAVFAGSAFGGVLAGRASPHRSYIEPALAAMLVVGSLYAFVHSTSLGRILITSYHREVTHTAWILAGVGAGGGLFGAFIGEATQPRSPSLLGLRWVLLSAIITSGALFASLTVATLSLVNEAAEQALGQVLASGHLDQNQGVLSETRVAGAAIAAAVTGAVLGGLVTQMGAPRRMLLPAMAGAFLVLGGLVIAGGAVVHRAGAVAGPAALVGAAGAVLALLGALLAYAAGRATGRLSGSGVPG